MHYWAKNAYNMSTTLGLLLKEEKEKKEKKSLFPSMAK
jgi:hypothetical protein